MKITFLGATHEVTGSCTMINAAGRNILIDCGMEQGKDIFENQKIPVDPGEIDCVLLTHAHIDHSGNIPILFKNGYDGPVYATEATSALCGIMLLDSAHIQEQEAEWKNRKAERAGYEKVEPIYTCEDAQHAIDSFVPCRYGASVEIFPGVTARFTDMGHLLGSSSVELTLMENGETRTIVFSGDVGNHDQPLLNDPQPVKHADYAVIESTYGDRLHPARIDYIEQLTAYLQRAFDRGGNVVIPSFAVGRTQELLYFIRQIKEQKLIKGHDHFLVYIDSPLANKATDIFMKSDDTNFDEDTRKLLASGENPVFFDDLRISVTADDSKAINFDDTPKVIISASGMCEAGRIRHHLKHNLWRRESLILFVGYQAGGTLGRILVDGADKVKLFGETIEVNAEICTLQGVSGHADKDGLIKWINAFEEKPRIVFVNHGEDAVCDSFSACLKDEYGFNTHAPLSGSTFDLITGEPEKLAEGVRLAASEKAAAAPDSPIGRLMAAAAKLSTVAKQMDGKPNKNIASFTQRINNLTSEIQNWLNN